MLHIQFFVFQSTSERKTKTSNKDNVKGGERGADAGCHVVIVLLEFISGSVLFPLDSSFLSIAYLKILRASMVKAGCRPALSAVHSVLSVLFCEQQPDRFGLCVTRTESAQLDLRDDEAKR